MTLANNALTTLAAVKTELGITDTSSDTYIEDLINVVSTQIETYLGRQLGYQAGAIENVEGYGTYRIQVSRTPVIAVDSVVINNFWQPSFTVTAGELVIEDGGNSGNLYWRPGFPWTVPRPAGTITADPMPGEEEKAIRVTYDAGYVLPANAPAVSPQLDLPLDIQRAATIEVASQFQQTGRDREISDEKLMSYSVKYKKSSSNMSPFNDLSAVMLAHHKRIECG